MMETQVQANVVFTDDAYLKTRYFPRADGGEVVRGESWVRNAYENLAFVTFGTIPQYTYPLPDPIDTVLEIEYNE